MSDRENAYPGKMLRIYIGQDDMWDGEPLYEAIVRKLRHMDIAGAAVHRGVMGYGVHQRLHKGPLLELASDLPIVISAVDSEEKVRKVLPMLREMVREGLATISDAEVIEYRPDDLVEETNQSSA